MNQTVIKVPDFRYPADVANDAEKTLKTAIAERDGHTIVASLVQLGLAKTSIAQNNAVEVCKKIDDVLSKENLLTPDLRALVILLRANIIDDAPHKADLPDNLAPDWARIIDPLENGDITALKQPLTSYSDLIEMGDEWGSRAIPTLYDFLMMRYASETYFSYEQRQAWLLQHLADTDIVPTLYIEQYILHGSVHTPWSPYNLYKEDYALYQKYAKHPESALLLRCNYPADKDYPYFVDYLQHHPDASLAALIKNQMAKLEDCKVSLSYPSLIQSTDGLEVTAHSRNVREFTLSLYRLPSLPESYSSKKMEVRGFELVQTRKLTTEGIVPFDADHLTTTFDPVPYGRYIVLASYPTANGVNEEKTMTEGRVRSAMISVSDLRTFRITPQKIETRQEADYLTNQPLQVFAVNSQTGAPVSDATISYNFGVNRSKKDEYSTCQTNKDGYATIDGSNRLNYLISKGADSFLPETNDYNGMERKLGSVGLEVQTDLGIYRPGETIHLSVIAWKSGYFKAQPTDNLLLSITFRDASGNEIIKKEVVTDNLGQALADFAIPTDRMNGQFSFTIRSVDGKDYYSHTSRIDVSEYKTPTFYVDLSNTETTQVAGAQARVQGCVKTYSGMPVANAKVDCTLSAHSWMWWAEDSSFDKRHFSVTTDKEGNFEYLCPAEWTASEASSEGRRPFWTYVIDATCTNEAGETHEGRQEFRIGRHRGLSASDGTSCLKSGEPAPYEIHFVSSDPAEKSVLCHYQLCRVSGKDTLVIKEEDFMSDVQQFNWDKIPSGEYLLKASIVGDAEAEKAEAALILYRETDALPPVTSPLWIPTSSQTMDEKGHIRVLVGNTTASYLYYIISLSDHVLKAGWLHYEPGMHWFEADMPMKADEHLNISFFTIQQGQSYSESFSFRSPIYNEVRLTAVSFRDKIQPGSTEHWSFRLTDYNGKPMQGARMLLELYNEALHALSSNDWHLYTTAYAYNMYEHSMPSYGVSDSELGYSVPRHSAGPLNIRLPHENLYGHAFYQTLTKHRMYGNDIAYAMVEESPMPMMMESAMAGSAVRMAKAAPMVADAEEAEEEVKKPAMSDVAVRADEVKVALWKPQLTADAEGLFSVEFDVPNFNTTYYFQALAYDAEARSTYLRKKVLAQRSVMVQASLPRFLRAGDSIELVANVMNATDSLLCTEALIELFDPRSGEVLQSEQYQLQLESHATSVVRITCQAAMDAPYIGFRVKALAADGNGDGEQQLLPILSNITPVIETQPFYLQPDLSQLSLDVLTPSLADKNARLTLEYCNNPTWYCVTALPSIINVDEITSTGLAHNLFALSLAAKLSAENPSVAEAIRSWKAKQGQEGDVLVSALQQNADLKISPLLASPWLPEAERQTLRMQALDQLFDQQQNATFTTKLINNLQLLKAKDGGFLWLDFNGDRREASYWATSVVLELLGELNHLGCLPDNALLRSLITDATHYFDAETLKMEEEMLKDAKKYGYETSYLRFWSYIYIRQLLADVVGYSSKSQGKAVFKLADKTLTALERQWGELQMTSRALAAVTLHRYNRTSKARGVIESVRQFAQHDPRKGMYWESLERSGFSPVACTSAMLQAFAEVSPRKEEIDEMRQWLLLEKQTSDWGSSSMAIDAVYALLNTGSDWLHTSVDSLPQFEILVDGQPLDVSDTDCHLGYVRLSLPAATKKVEVRRNGSNPAWGSLYHQFVAPMTEVKAQGVDELHITKQFVRVEADGKTSPMAEGDTLKVGERIRTTLRIEAAKDLEYVTLVDQRPAFLEPVDQKSHYTRAERFYYYLETKDAVTNAFISRLPMGTHSLTYECFVTAPGTFTSGIATVQSQYAPQFVAHSAGSQLHAKNK